MRSVAIGQKNRSDAGGKRSSEIYTLIEPCKLDDVDPRALFADALSGCRPFCQKGIHEPRAFPRG